MIIELQIQQVFAMTQPTHTTQFTYDDYLLFLEDGRRHELIDGEHYVTPSPITKHQKISVNLLISVGTHLQSTKAGHVLAAPMDVLLSEFDVVQPDLLFISKDRASILTEKNIQGAPDLLVEILSTSTRKTDEIIKRKLYEQHRVSEYWIIDPELETVKVYRFSDTNTYERVAELSLEAHHTLTTPLLPNWQLPLKQLFEFS